MPTCDPLLSDDLLGSPDAATAASINHQLELLTGSGSILRIKVWSPNGTVVFSDLPALRGRTFEIESDLAEALEGHTEADISALVADENVFEQGIASKLLEIYLPIGPEGEEPSAHMRSTRTRPSLRRFWQPRDGTSSSSSAASAWCCCLRCISRSMVPIGWSLS